MADSGTTKHDGQTHGGGALQTAKDLFAGAAGGVAQVLLGGLFPSP
jgi:solute carrier family 25 carnitine/acylcarnitine transporter 20/29